MGRKMNHLKELYTTMTQLHMNDVRADLAGRHTAENDALWQKAFGHLGALMTISEQLNDAVERIYTRIEDVQEGNDK